MPTDAPSPAVVVIGYGSLLSGLGLQPFGRLRIQHAARIALLNVRRGFGKFSQHSDRFAMTLEPLRTDEPLEAQLLAADAPAADAPEGIAFSVRPNDLARLSDREGYSSGAIQRLRQEATARHQDVAAFLWSLLEAAGFDTSGYRERLYKLISYTSPHYIPHPVRLNGAQFAVTFLAPGREGSGSSTVVPVRVRTGTADLMTAPEAWRRKPNPTQLSYFSACLLGGVHGVGIHDLLLPLADDAPLSERVREALRADQPHELPRFLDMTGLDHGSYWTYFGPPTHGVRRSGLEDFMSGRNARRSALG